MTDTVERGLGRRPISFDEGVEEGLSVFTGWVPVSCVHQSKSSIMTLAGFSSSASPFATSPPWKCAQSVGTGMWTDDRIFAGIEDTGLGLLYTFIDQKLF